MCHPDSGVDLGVYDQSPEWQTQTERAAIGTVEATATLRRVATRLDELLPHALERLSQELA